jgi:hypothetical protein
VDFRTKQSFRQAFTDIFGHISICLWKNVAPGKNGILWSAEENWKQWLREEGNYVQTVWSRGKIDPALETVLHYAAEQDNNAGNGIFDEVTGEEKASLSVCRNDHEFAFVTRVLEEFF